MLRFTPKLSTLPRCMQQITFRITSPGLSVGLPFQFMKFMIDFHAPIHTKTLHIAAVHATNWVQINTIRTRNSSEFGFVKGSKRSDENKMLSQMGVATLPPLPRRERGANESRRVEAGQLRQRDRSDRVLSKNELVELNSIASSPRT